MSNPRTHHVTTADGVTIGATVDGQGPSLVFLQGVIGDGDLDWQAVLGHVTGRFTCHLPSWRGRGLSSDHADLSIGRLADDVLTYVDSIGEPAGIVGWSGGAGLALVAAGAQPDAVTAVAAVDPGMPALMDDQERAAFRDAIRRVGELASAGRVTEACRAFAGFVFDDAEVAVAEDAGYLQGAGRYVENLLSFLQQQMEYDGPMPHDPAVLRAISAPVLLLHGSKAKPYAMATVRHVTRHIPNVRVREIAGAGHAAPLTHPEQLAAALTEFFSPAQQHA